MFFDVFCAWDAGNLQKPMEKPKKNKKTIKLRAKTFKTNEKTPKNLKTKKLAN